MKKCLCLMLILTLFLLCGCESETNEFELENKINTSDFTTSFFEDVTEFESMSWLPVTSIISDDGSEEINTYVITQSYNADGILLGSENYHFSTYSDKETGCLKSISMFTEKKNYIYLSLLLNMLVLNIDDSIDCEELDKKYEIVSIDSKEYGEEEKFILSIHSTEDFRAFNLNIK